MEKSLFEQMGGTYHQEGDYLIPDLALPKTVSIGIWGQRRRLYLREHRNSIYTALFLGGKLNDHLVEIDRYAEEMFSQLVKQMAKSEGISEQLKANNQMKWVSQMNGIRHQIEEMVYKELIYV